MADEQPPTEVLDNLAVLMDMGILKDEKDWRLVRDLDKVPPSPVLDQQDKKDGK